MISWLNLNTIQPLRLTGNSRPDLCSCLCTFNRPTVVKLISLTSKSGQVNGKFTKGTLLYEPPLITALATSGQLRYGTRPCNIVDDATMHFNYRQLIEYEFTRNHSLDQYRMLFYTGYNTGFTLIHRVKGRANSFRRRKQLFFITTV